jgi:Cof subfamily protein (haloacid dehalogenase superfamily)
MAESPIRLVVVDVDGTLLTSRKELTARAVRAVHRLHEAGVRVALTSGRPPRGLRMLIEPLSIEAPLAAFNGGMYAAPDLSVLSESPIAAVEARRMASLMGARGLDVWVYAGTAWYVRDAAAPHVARERATVQFPPTVVPDFDGLFADAVKLVGVSDDYELVARMEADAQAERGVSASRSQPYYLDVTHPEANKGAVVRHFAREFGIATAEIAAIGDGPNDVLAFAAAGMSIAMGNASPEVRAKATHITAANDDEGFARAMDELVLPRAPAGT